MSQLILSRFLPLFLLFQDLILFCFGAIVMLLLLPKFGPITPLDLVLAAGYFFSAPISLLTVRLMKSLSVPSHEETSYLLAAEKFVDSVTKYGSLLLAPLTALTLFLASQQRPDLLVGAFWISSLVFLTELIVIRFLFWIIKTTSLSLRWKYFLFFAISPLVIIPLAMGSADVVKDFLRLPAWVDLPIVTYVPVGNLVCLTRIPSICSRRRSICL